MLRTRGAASSAEGETSGKHQTIPGINIPTGTPLVYDLDASLKVIPKAGAVAPLNGAYLGDAAEVAAKAAAVAAQTEKK